MELIIGVPWSELRWEASWRPLVPVAALLPCPGEEIEVRLDPFFETPPDGSASLLWQPPHSELNGWRERPSEVLESCVIEGELTRLEALPDAPHGGTWTGLAPVSWTRPARLWTCPRIVDTPRPSMDLPPYRGHAPPV